jgi:hypothetical protein
MKNLVLSIAACWIGFTASSQGYSGDFTVSRDALTYHFTLTDGRLEHPVYTIADDTKYISTMYLPDSVVLLGIDSLMIVHKKDSLLKQFLENFSGTVAEYSKKGRMVVTRHYSERLDSVTNLRVLSEDQRMNFYPNGKPYAQFYLKNGNPSRSVIYFTRDGETDHISDLSSYAKGEEVLIQNPWNFRMRKKMYKVTIE